MDESVDVRVSPLFGEPSDIQDYFDSKGYDDAYTRLVVFNKFCLLKFASVQRAHEFAKQFDKATINNVTVFVTVVGPPAQIETKPAPLSPATSRTVAFHGIDGVTDRLLWDLTNRTGFVRQVECRGAVGFVQFDTPDDAQRCVAELAGGGYKAELVEDFVLNKPNMAIPLQDADVSTAQVPLRQNDKSPKKKQKDKKRRSRPPGDREDSLPPWERERVRGYEN